MSPLLSAALGSLLRHGLSSLAGFFVTRGIWSQNEASDYVIGAAAGLLALLLTLWNKYGGRLKLLTALAAPAGTTEIQVERMVDAGQTPAVSTPKDVVPQVAVSARPLDRPHL